MKIADLKNKRIAILGFGKEGQSSLGFLLEQGIDDVTILDKNLISDDILLPFTLAESEDSRKSGNKINTVFGESYLDNLESYDIIVKSPGVSPFQDKLMPHREKFVSQTQIFFENYSGKVIGITGTKGKSTISTLLYTCLKTAGYDAKLVGNIGSPVLDEIDFYGEVHDYVIYELSSYMLQDFSPKLHIGFLNNIFPCHLDWHYDSLAIYKEAKVNILRHAEIKILHGNLATDNEVIALKDEKTFFDSVGRYKYDEKTFFIDGQGIYSGEVKLLGEHNRKNISGIIAILDSIIPDKIRIHDLLSDVLPDFVGLPNRIEDIGIYEGICFINDAIATTPDSTIVAIDTFEHDIQTIFLGGEDSGFNFSVLREKILTSNIQNIIAFPDTSVKIFPEIEIRDYEQAFEIEIEGKSIQFIKTRSMKQGVDFAYKTTLPGRVALLSCGAPSFSLWKSYLLKAEEFKKEVQEY